MKNEMLAMFIESTQLLCLSVLPVSWEISAHVRRGLRTSERTSNRVKSLKPMATQPCRKKTKQKDSWKAPSSVLRSGRQMVDSSSTEREKDRRILCKD